LWQRDQEELLEEMIMSGMNSILIKVAALGLDPKKHLGKSLQHCQNELLELVLHFYSPYKHFVNK
jgi:diphthine-ammonia ligase